MKKKRNIKSASKIADIVIGIVCVSGIAVSLGLFASEWNRVSVSETKKPVATVVHKKNTTQKRLSDEEIWQKVKVADIVYDGDRIRTDAESEATIIFNDGQASIDLYENTLITIRGSSSSNGIDFAKGSVNVLSTDVTDEKVVVVTNGNKVLSLKGNSNVVVESSKKGESSVAVTSGSVEVKENPVQKREKKTALQKVVETVLPPATKNQKKKTEPVENSSLNSAEQISVQVVSKTISAGEVAVIEEEKPVQAVETVSIEKAETQEKTKKVVKKVRSASVQSEEKQREVQKILTAAVGSEKAAEITETVKKTNEVVLKNQPEKVKKVTQKNDRQVQEQQRKVEIATEEKAYNEEKARKAEEAKKAEEARIAKEKTEQKRREELAAKREAERKERERIAAEKKAAEEKKAREAELARKAEEERKTRELAAKREAEKKERERIAAEKKAAEEKRIVEEAKKAREAELARQEAERLEQERLAREAEEKRKAEEARMAREAEEEKKAEEARKAEAARIAKERAEQRRIAREKAAAEKAEQERIAAGKAETERQSAERASRQAKEEESRNLKEPEVYDEKKPVEKTEKKAAVEEKKQKEIKEEQQPEEKKQEPKKIEPKKTEVKITGKRPVLKSPSPNLVITEDFFENGNTSIKFTWGKMTDAKKYHLVIYRDGLLDKKIVDKTVKGNAYTLRANELEKLDNGTYVWWVQGIDVVDGKSYESKKSESYFSINVDDAGAVELDMSDFLH